MGRTDSRRVALPDIFHSRLRSVLDARRETLGDLVVALSTGTSSHRRSVFTQKTRAETALLEELRRYFDDEQTWRYLMGQSSIFDAAPHEALAKRRAEEAYRREVA